LAADVLVPPSETTGNGRPCGYQSGGFIFRVTSTISQIADARPPDLQAQDALKDFEGQRCETIVYLLERDPFVAQRSLKSRSFTIVVGFAMKWTAQA
jgi:hypothetical protein